MITEPEIALGRIEVETATTLPWVRVFPDAPYFLTDQGKTWTPIGQNDGISWPELHGLYKRSDVATAEDYLKMLSEHGVTVLRLMLEYSQYARHNFEKPAGRFRPEMIQLWDDLFALCEKYGLRILLTPFDTFWMWINWDRHPYNKANGGPCADRREILLCRATREAVKNRLRFAVERWGGSGALFAWDLWNEIHPSYAQDSAECFNNFIEELSDYVRTLEMRLYGRTHPQTVSVFGPHMVLDKRIPESIFRHPSLDFASTHFYEEGTIDHPQNTVDAALSTGRLMRESLAELRDDRPFLDSEHGPIHTFKDHHRTLPEPFDDEYFRHIQWAHFCAGGAGGGMRWPNRSPHSLTAGMRLAQQGLASFLSLIDWQHFRRRNWNDEARVDRPEVKAIACGDTGQALVWLIRTDHIGSHGMLRRDIDPLFVSLTLPCLLPGTYRVTLWNTLEGCLMEEREVENDPNGFALSNVRVSTDLALAIRRQEP
jgi:mannan endo-1,4-beta-mannosidase